MPFALPAAATAVAAAAPAAAAKATLMATLKSVAFKAITNLAISAAMSALQPQVGGQGGRTFEWTIDPDAPIPFAAGRVGVAGSVVHRDTFGPDLMYYGIPAVLSGAGPITGYDSVRADDFAVTFDATGKAITSQYAGELWFRSTLGNQPDVALSSPSGLKNGASLPGWTTAHKLSGKAAYMVVMGENSKGSAFPTGEIKPLITFRGLKGWDPRLDSTYPGGSGACRLDNPATWVYLTNPILWALKWSLGLWEGPTGKGAPQVDHQVGGIGAKPGAPPIDIDWLEVGYREGATANTGKLADQDEVDFDEDIVGPGKPISGAGKIYADAVTTNTTPGGYVTLLPTGGVRLEIKDSAALGNARASGNTIVQTDVPASGWAGAVQVMRTPTQGSFKRSANTATSWRGCRP